MKKIKSSYVAGPYTSSSREEYEHNIGKLFAMCHSTLLDGTVPICLPLITAGMEHTTDAASVPYTYWLELCFSLIEAADFIAVVPEWEASSGTRAEVAYATQLRKPIIYLDEPTDVERPILMTRMSELQERHPFAAFAFDYLFRLQEERIHEEIIADA